MANLRLYDPAYANEQRMRVLREGGASPHAEDSRQRMGGDRFADLLGSLFGFGKAGTPALESAGEKAAWNAWTNSRLANVGRIGAGGLVLGGVLSAAGELNNPDPTVTNAQKLGGAAAAGLGSTALGIAGGVLGAPLGPVGSLVLGSLGSALGSQLGGAGRAAVNVFGPSELDKQIAAYTRTAQAQADAKAYEMATLLPIQKQVADAVLANQLKGAAAMAPIDAQRMRNQALYQGLINGQQQSAQLANTMLTNVTGGYLS